MRRTSVELIFLLTSHHSELSLNDVSSYFNITERAVRYEIHHLNSFLYDEGLSVIEISKDQMLKLELSDQELEFIISKAYSKKYLLTAEERQLFMILNSLFKGGVKFAYEWMEILEVSKSTIDQDVKKAKESVSEFDLELKSVSKEGYSVSGDEWSIRLMLNKLILKTIDLENLIRYLRNDVDYLEIGTRFAISYLNLDIIELTYNSIIKLIDEKDSLNNKIKIMQLAVLISIWDLRVRENNLLKTPKENISEEPKIHIMLLVNELKALLSINEHQINSFEDCYLSYYLEGYAINHNLRFQNNWANLQFLTIQYINQVQSLTGLKFSEDKDLFNRLYKHIESLENRISKNIVIVNPLENMIKDQYQDIYLAVTESSYLLKEYFVSEITDSELCYLTIHFSASKEKIIKKAKRKYKVAVICGHGVATGELLAENLKKSFPIEVVAILGSNAINSIKKLEIDFAVSTLKMSLAKVEVITVNPILLAYDKRLISNYMLQNPINKLSNDQVLCNQVLFNAVWELINVKKRDEINADELEKIFNTIGFYVKKEGLQPMITDVLKVNHILIKKKAETWQESIEIAAQPLLDDNIIKKEYIKDMIDSVNEHGPYIVLDKGMALAHAKPGENINELGFSVVTLAEPVSFGHKYNDPVDIVFCLAAIDNFSHLKIMKTLVSVISERAKLDSLINAKSSDEFIKLIKKYEE